MTDRGWFERLASETLVDEVNFWQPSGRQAFRILEPGGLFLFKLHSPDDYIVGGGVFAHWSRLPVSLAWDAFGIKNGVDSLSEMATRVARYHGPLKALPMSQRVSHEVGCIILEQPFFLPRDQWVPIGEWSRNLVRGRSYDVASAEGRRLLDALAETQHGREFVLRDDAVDTQRYGAPTLVRPRLGQGSFRVVVTDAYNRRCAMTGERVLPVLEAAHIQRYADGGEHTVSNGLLLRSDLHTLFDRGYLSVDPEYRVVVSERLRDEFHNGRDYYALRDREISVPSRPEDRPDPKLLELHLASVA